MNDEDRLAELLLVWEERHERGEDVSAAELNVRHPIGTPLPGEPVAHTALGSRKDG